MLHIKSYKRVNLTVAELICFLRNGFYILAIGHQPPKLGIVCVQIIIWQQIDQMLTDCFLGSALIAANVHPLLITIKEQSNMQLSRTDKLHRKLINWVFLTDFSGSLCISREGGLVSAIFIIKNNTELIQKRWEWKGRKLFVYENEMFHFQN